MIKLPATAFMTVAVILLTLITSCNQADEDALRRIRKRGEIKIAVSSGYVPFSFHNSRRELAGFDIDMARAIAERLGAKAVFVEVPWSTILEGLRSGQYDAVVSSMSVTEERAAQVSFSSPYYYSRAQLFVRKNSKIKKTEDLRGELVGAAAGTTHEEEVKKLTSRQAILYPNDEEALQQLVKGAVGAIVTDEIIGMYAIRHRHLPLEPLGGSLRSERIAVAVRKTDQTLLHAVNDIVENMRRKGDIRKLIEKTAEGRYE